MNRKWKIALGVLTAIIVFCLWYTRPRNFDDLFGSGEFQNFSMLAITMDKEIGEKLLAYTKKFGWKNND